MLLGIDTGGTFTDFALIAKDPKGQSVLTTYKVLSTPDAPQRAILQGIKEMGLAEIIAKGDIKVIHGSTVATNALLERKCVRTAFITNKGFKDILSIARQTRPSLYSLESPALVQPVPDQLCLEITGRLDAQGHIIEDLLLPALQALVTELEALKPDAIAITLLFSFLNDQHEIEVEQYLRQHLSWQPFICRSAFVLPEYKEYERGIATWLNASLGPLVESYLLSLKADINPAPLSIMQSSGGTIGAEQASKKSVNLLLSGPAGGLAAASFLGQSLNQKRLLTFDMGGTSTDVALIDGHVKLTSEGVIGSFPVAVPMVDMHTIGAGGGSIAYVDSGGLLQVGPQSAGASPGPACYGLGGTQATVTDANLVLGRLLPKAFMGGKVHLSKAAATSAIAPLATRLQLSVEDCADGIIQVANEHMARALRLISIERGHDPLDYRLCCFGGAGGLHICALAKALGMKRALVPIHAGVLSALGMYLAPIERQLTRSFQCLLSSIDQSKLEQMISHLKNEGKQQLLSEQIEENQIDFNVSANLRYEGQSASINIPFIDIIELSEAFQKAHLQRYGHRLSRPIELVSIRVAVSYAGTQHALPVLPNKTLGTREHEVLIHGLSSKVPVYNRTELAPNQSITGPALIAESSSTTLIDAGWTATVDSTGNLFLSL